MSEMKTVKGIIENVGSIRKPRSPQEILAAYNQRLDKYLEFKMMGDSPGIREQVLMFYAEIKILGWALGKDEKSVIKDMQGKSEE